MIHLLRPIFFSLLDHYRERLPFIRDRMRIGSSLGVVGFPLYYFVWFYWFPQPYENLWLRLVCALACLFAFPHRWLGLSMGRLYPVYLYVMCILILPGFFVFMLLANDAAAVWLASAMIAFFILPLLVDWRNMLVISISGSLIGVFGFLLWSSGGEIPEEFWSYLPVLGFALLCGVAFNIGEEMLLQHRHQSMIAVSANMAHEIRTPLLTVRSAAEGLRRYWPILTGAYQRMEQEGRLDDEIDPEHWEAMNEALEHVVSEVDRMNAVVDMVLMNLRGANRTQHLEELSMADVVAETLARYPFDPGEQQKLHLHMESDFYFRGRRLLATHILFNLLKNAFYAIAQARKGEIELRLEPGAHMHRLIFHDTGAGMPAHVQRRLFEPFFTTRDTGTGVGLSFCARAMEEMGGHIEVTSEEGVFTEFTLWFPTVQGAVRSAIQNDKAARR